MRLIRRFVFWFAEYFPYLFPLLLAAFFLVQIDTALAADEVPADSVPAGSCQNWSASLADGVKVFCLQSDATAAYLAMLRQQFGSNASLSLIECVKRPTSDFEHVCSYRRVESCPGPWCLDVVREFTISDEPPVTWHCPPAHQPAYDIGPLEKENGSKWCAKELSPNTCSDKAGTFYDSGVNFYALNLSDGTLPTCKEGCEVTPEGVGACFPITLPSGTKAHKCNYGSAMFTGNQCPFPIGEEPVTGTGDDVGTPEQPSTTEQDCVPTYNAATGTTSCTGVKHTENPGTSSCGTVNGAWTCVPNNDGGSSTTTDQREIINSTDPVTGNTTTTDRTTSTTVNCQGADCTSTAKTTTTTTVKGADGSVISSSTDCVGSGCGAGAPGDPDAEGDELTPPEYPEMPNPQGLSDDVNEGVDGYRDSVMSQFERDDYEYIATIDQATSDKVSGAITANMSPSCVNPTIPVGIWTFTVDMCYYSSKIRPYLDFMCVMFTLIYCWHLLREAIYTTGA